MYLHSERDKAIPSRVSGPLLDRIDIQVEVDGVAYDDLVSEKREETSAEVKERTDAARRIQRERFKGGRVTTNGEGGKRTQGILPFVQRGGGGPERGVFAAQIVRCAQDREF